MVDTDVPSRSEPEVDPGREPGSDGAGPGSPPARRGLPTWLRRVGITVLMVFAVGVFVWGSGRALSGSEESDPDPVIVAQFPAPGARALRQTEVGAELKAGYDGRLTVNGITIPEDQMQGAIDPASVTPDELRRYGIRPNNKTTVKFTPGPGKVIEEFDTGDVIITVRYFRERQGQDTGRSITWRVRVD